MTGSAYRAGDAKNKPSLQNRPIVKRATRAGYAPSAKTRANTGANNPANSELVKKIRAHLDPFETTAQSRTRTQAAPQPRANTSTNIYGQTRTNTSQNIHTQTRANTSQNIHTQTRANTSQNIHAQTRSNTANISSISDTYQSRSNMNSAVSADMRRRDFASQAARPAQHTNSKQKLRYKTESQIRAERKAAGKTARARAKALAKAEKARVKAERKLLAGEIVVEKRPIPVTIIMLAFVFTIMAMILIYSGTQIYEHTHQISELRDELKSVTDKATELTLELEIRDDIRTVERIARERIGMVKGDLVEKRFVSLNDTDDRIELIGGDPAIVGTPLSETVSTGLLSGIFSALFGNK